MGKQPILTWQERCERHPAHRGIVTTAMVQSRMQEEIDDLRARVAELERDRDAWMLLAKAKPLPMDGCPAYCETGRKLSERVAELELDAARYRHMKSNATFQNRNGPGLYWYLPRYNRELPIGERLDAAIDAAMQGKR